jgi:hypothetical protein
MRYVFFFKSKKELVMIRQPEKVAYLRKVIHSDADKSLARPGRKQATATEDFEFHISYL